MHIKRFFRLKAWALLALLTLTGCDALKGLGDALGDVFKNIKMP